MVERIKPERLNLEAELVNLLRWEDDGGKITDIKYSMLDRQFVQPVRITARRHGTSLQWNEQFAIGPFQAGTRIDSLKKGLYRIAGPVTTRTYRE
jgi:hypothetical protein